MVLPSVADAVVCATAAGAASGFWALRRWPPLPSGCLRASRVPGGPAEQAAFATLHLLARAAQPLRAGLTDDTARTAARRLRPLLGAEAIALVAVRPPTSVPNDPDDPDDPDDPNGHGDPRRSGDLRGPDDPGGSGDFRGSGCPGDLGGSGDLRGPGNLRGLGGLGGPSGPGDPRDPGAPGVPGDSGDFGGGPLRAEPRLLAWAGPDGGAHAAEAVRQALPVLASGRPRVGRPGPAGCGDPHCPARVAMTAPLTVEGRVEGVLTAYWSGASAARIHATGEAARQLATQLELAELDAARVRLGEAETRALRAQISPHFVYNSLTTIASFVRTDPARARALLLDFADFARYSFRNPRDFTTLADELRSIDRYLLLERARFGERLLCSVDVAPEVLPVAVPFLALQPLVENAVRHGMAGRRGPFHITITARDSGAEAAISVEDDGAGMDPERLQEILSAPLGRPGPTGWGSIASRPRRRDGHADPGIGLANVDERMRQVYGDEYGLTVETALGAGTKVNLRVPKYRPGVFPE